MPVFPVFGLPICAGFSNLRLSSLLLVSTAFVITVCDDKTGDRLLSATLRTLCDPLPFLALLVLSQLVSVFTSYESTAQHRWTEPSDS